MAIALIFWILALAVCLHAVIMGGRFGRWGAGLYMGAVFLSALVTMPGTTWRQTNLPLLAVDCLYLISLYVLAIKSRRYWPIWSAGFQLLSVLTSIATIFDPTTPPQLYRAIETCWSIPIFTTMTIGIILDRRAHLDRTANNDPGITSPSS